MYAGVWAMGKPLVTGAGDNSGVDAHVGEHVWAMGKASLWPPYMIKKKKKNVLQHLF